MTWALSPRQLIVGAAAWVAFSAMGTAVGTLIVDVYEGTSLHQSERALVEWIETTRTPSLDRFTHLTSTLGDTTLLIAVASGFVLFALLRWRRLDEAVFVVGSLVVQGSIFWTITFFVDRERPPVDPLDSWLTTNAGTHNSFPSGHTGGATALYLSLALAVAANLSSRRSRIFVLSLGAAAIMAVATSRIYRGMHYPTDIVGAVTVGTATVLTIRWLFASATTQRTLPRWSDRGDGGGPGAELDEHDALSRPG